MRGDRDDHHHVLFVRVVAPKDAVSRRGLVLCVSLKKLAPMGTRDRLKLMGVEARMPEVDLELSQSAAHGLKSLGKPLVILKARQVSVRLCGEL